MNETHWTEDWIVESVDENGLAIFEFYDMNSNKLGERRNMLMAQIALMDYCAHNEDIDTYHDPIQFLMSMQKLMICYKDRYEKILKQLEG